MIQELQENPIKCVKYNYSLDAGIQNHLQFESLIKVSDDGKRLILTLKKPCEDK